MGSEKTQENSNRHSVMKWVLGGLVMLVVAIVVLLVAGKFWIAPALIESRMQQRVSSLLNGDVRVENTRLGYDGRVTAGALSVEDAQGRPRLRLTDLRLDLDGITDLNPRLSTVTIGAAEIDLHPDQGPLLKESRPPSKGDVSLESLEIRSVHLRMHTEDQTVAWIDGARLDATRAGALYEVALEPDANSPEEFVRVAGTVNPRADELDLEARMDRTLDANQASVLLQWAGLPSRLAGNGRLDVNVRVGGNYANLVDLKTNGHVNLTDATFSYHGAPLLSGLRFLCDVNDTLCRAQIDSRLLEGTLNGTFTLEHEGLTMGRCQLDLQGDQVDLSRLASNMPDWDSFTKGVASGRYRGTFHRLKVADVNGTGALHVKGMDVHLAPVISQILEVVDVTDTDPLSASDAMVQFDNQGPALTIRDGSVASSVTAIKIERGGRVNLKERYVDLYAIWVPLKRVESLLSKLPFSELLTDLKDRLIRVRVEGTWDQSASKLVSKEPLEDVSEAIGSFVQDVAKAGGHLPQEMFDAFTSMFE